MSIHILSPEIQRRIAAGEVIDRPASVVKELLENALDAGARAISVEVRDGGLGLIRVADDGCGMSRTDAALALERFSTSKINSLADLEQIRTLGFRGEALSSIAAMAQVEILTRAADELAGTRVKTVEGQIVAEAAASPVGTSIAVNNLFSQVPARRRFIKSRMREAELVQQMVARYTLAYPQVAFRLVVDGRERLVAPPGTPLARIGAVWGRDVADEMVPIEWQALDLRVHGLISRPTIGRSRRSDQHFFVNGRPTRAGLLAVMLERPYAGRLPPGRYPLCAIHIEIAPRYIDVNVHPQKAEVRFSQERSVYSALLDAVQQALQGFPQHTWAGQPGIAWPFGEVSYANAVSEPSAPYGSSGLHALAQLHDTYILAQTPDGLAIADQHAAHEQALFEQLAQGGERFSLSPTVRLNLTPREVDALEQVVPVLGELGIEVEPFGWQTFLIRTLPDILQGQDATALVTALIEEAMQHRGNADELRDALAIKAACLGAVKAGARLTVEQMQDILDALSRAWSPTTCPHGRPAIVSISLEELYRRFDRT